MELIQESTIRDGGESAFRFNSSRIGDSIIGPAIFRPWSVPDSTRPCEGRRSGSIPGEDAQPVLEDYNPSTNDGDHGG